LTFRWFFGQFEDNKRTFPNKITFKRIFVHYKLT
jgi:hypothetical protein